MKTEISADHLTWEVIVTGSEDELEAEYYHKCIPWLHENNIPHEVVITEREMKFDESGFSDEFLEMAVDISIIFDNPEEATMWKLRWSEAE